MFSRLITKAIAQKAQKGANVFNHLFHKLELLTWSGINVYFDLTKCHTKDCVVF